MTKLLEKALEAVRALPPSEQDEIARALIAITSDECEDAEEVDEADMPGLLEGLADAAAGRFATDEEVEAVFKRFKK